MALWPLTTMHFKSGADLFLEFTLLHKRRFDVTAMLARNAPALIREIAILGGPFLVVMKLRWSRRASSSLDARAWEKRPRPRLSRARVVPEEPRKAPDPITEP